MEPFAFDAVRWARQQAGRWQMVLSLALVEWIRPRMGGAHDGEDARLFVRVRRRVPAKAVGGRAGPVPPRTGPLVHRGKEGAGAVPAEPGPPVRDAPGRIKEAEQTAIRRPPPGRAAAAAETVPPPVSGSPLEQTRPPIPVDRTHAPPILSEFAPREVAALPPTVARQARIVLPQTSDSVCFLGVDCDAHFPIFESSPSAASPATDAAATAGLGTTAAITATVGVRGPSRA